MTRNKNVTFTPIGVIRSSHHSGAGTPIQPAYAKDCEGQVVVDPKFEGALTDIEGFDRIWLIYHFDRAAAFKPQVIPYRDTRKHGLFSTRSPCRPNKIGMSVVRLVGREGNVLNIRGIDILDETPLLDIKPYVPDFDSYPSSEAGWLDERREDRRVADDRFEKPE